MLHFWSEKGLTLKEIQEYVDICMHVNNSYTVYPPAYMCINTSCIFLYTEWNILPEFKPRYNWEHTKCIVQLLCPPKKPDRKLNVSEATELQCVIILVQKVAFQWNALLANIVIWSVCHYFGSIIQAMQHITLLAQNSLDPIVYHSCISWMLPNRRAVSTLRKLLYHGIPNRCVSWVGHVLFCKPLQCPSSPSLDPGFLESCLCTVSSK